MANELVVRNGFISKGNIEVSGSLGVSGSTNIIGNLIVKENVTDEVVNSVTRTLKGVGGTPSVDWDNKALYDTNQTESIDWENKTLEEGGVINLNWSLREVYDNTSTLSLNWNDRLLFDDSGTNQSVNWNNRVLYDATGVDVLDWQTKTMSGMTTVQVDNLVVDTPYVPTGSTDPTGSIGTISWSGDSLYVKNSTEWVKFTGLTSW